MELPDSVKNDVFGKFLFEAFIRVFHCNFSVQIPNSFHQFSYFNWENPVYAYFMTDLMQKMEPTFVTPNSVIYNELDEITEVIFYYDGKFDLGYDINGKSFYVLRYENSSTGDKSRGEAIGEFGCTFNHTSRFIYKSSSFCEGFFVRKRYWTEVLKEHSFVALSYK